MEEKKRMERRRHLSWERLEEIFEEMQRRADRIFEVFEPSLLSKPLWDAERCCLEPLVDVRESADAIVVTVDLPFVDTKEDIDITLLQDSLEIRAKTRRAIRFERWGTVQREIDFNEFRKTLRLPAEVKPEEANATFKRGVLKVLLPKKTRKMRIEIG